MKVMRPHLSALILASCIAGSFLTTVHGEPEATPDPKPDKPVRVVRDPDLENVRYGPHERNVLDVWKAAGEHNPVLFVVHGGGWLGGDKRGYVNTRMFIDLDWFLQRGVTVVAVNYRYSTQAPLPAPVYDAARALQFIRYKADELGIDKTRIIATGGSAGGCTSAWLATHDDLADPKSEDPVLRESTRLTGAYIVVGQTTIDPVTIKEWFGDIPVHHPMIPRAAGFASEQEMEAGYDGAKALYAEFSPVNHLDAGDPPVYLSCSGELDRTSDGIHHPIFGDRFKKRADEVGAPCIFRLQNSTNRNPDVIGWRDWVLERFGL